MKNKIAILILILFALCVFLIAAIYANLKFVKVSFQEYLNILTISFATLSLSYISLVREDKVSSNDYFSIKNYKNNFQTCFLNGVTIFPISIIVISFSLFIFSLATGFSPTKSFLIVFLNLLLFQSLIFSLNYKLNYLIMWILIDLGILSNILISSGIL